MASSGGQKIDNTAMSFNQICLISLTILGFILNQPWLVAFVAAVLMFGVFNPKWNLFKQIYKRIIKPAGLMKPKVAEGDVAPHQFAQFLGFIFLAAASICLFMGLWTAGWVLVWMVIALAALNLQLGFCMGCFLYFQMKKRKIAKAS